MIFEKIRERLQELCEQTYYNSVNGNRDEGIRNNAYHNAIDIINQVEDEYNNGWIPCSERLPEDEGVYIVTIEDECGSVRYCKVAFFSLYHPKHRWWDVECEYVYFGDVTYWMPLPKPYKKGE